MNTNQYILPHRVNMNEQNNPLLVLDDLYRNQTEFPIWRQCLYVWLKGIFSPHPLWTGKTPADMLYDLEQFERLIEASWLLHLHRPRPEQQAEVSEKNIFPSDARTSRVMQYWKWDFYPRWLNQEEMLQPYLVLDAFFDFLSLPQWREKLCSWLKQSLSSSSCEDLYNPDETLMIYEFMHKLLEATHLIYIRQWPKSPVVKKIKEP